MPDPNPTQEPIKYYFCELLAHLSDLVCRCTKLALQWTPLGGAQIPLTVSCAGRNPAILLMIGGGL